MSSTPSSSPAAPATGNAEPQGKAPRRRSRSRFARLAAAVAVCASAAATLVPLATPAQAGASSLVQLYSASSWLNIAVKDGSTAPGAPIVQARLTGTAEQLWIVPAKGTVGPIINAKSQLCLSTDGVAGHALYQDTCIGVGRQQWYNRPAKVLSFDYGYSAFQNTKYSLYMDVNGNSLSPGAAIIGWPNRNDNWGFPANEAFLPLG